MSNSNISPDYPWLGLASFTEETASYFFGRDSEIKEIHDRILENPLTILYGQSGLGKTSLLGAGLIPRLKENNLSPVLLRLRYEEDSPTLLEQTRTALGLNDSRSLWEQYHSLKTDHPKSSPILLFDQFEEIFTLGQADSNHRLGIQEWRTQISDLIQNRPPEELQNKLRENRHLAREFDFTSTPIRIAITLREDYLSYLEQWKNQLPMLTQNRMALQLLDGPRALEAVTGPASLGAQTLVNSQVAANIVRTAARVSHDTPLSQIKAVPPILSLLCEQLNLARLTNNLDEINASLVTEKSEDILQNFYQDSFMLFPENQRELIRELIEEEMVTVGGHRKPVAWDDAENFLLEGGIHEPTSIFRDLVQRRLITVEEHGISRLEITHDVLIPIIISSRDDRREVKALQEAERKQQLAEEKTRKTLLEKKRLRKWVIISSGVSLLAILTAIMALNFYKEAKKNREIAVIAEQQANRNYENSIKANRLNYETAIKTVNEQNDITLEGIAGIRIKFQDSTLKSLKELDTGNGNSDSYSNFLAAIYLDKYRNYALMKNWEQAHAALTSAHEILLNNKLLSLEQAELLAAVYAYQGVTDYYTNSKSNQVALDSIPKLKELANKFSKSWRITYYNLRNRNNLAVIANNEEEFHDISKEIHDLWSSSNENFDLALWAYVIQQNAYYSETSWKNMSLKELSELIEIVPSLNKFSPGQTVEIVKYLHNMLTRTAKRLAHEVIDRDKEERNRILKKLNEITLELELLLPSSNLAYERRSQYFTLEKLCRETGVEWRDRDSFLIAEASFISRTKHKFSKATRANMANLSGVSNNTSIAGSLDKLIKKPSFVYELQFIARRAQSYTLKELDDLVSNGPIRTIVSNIDKLEDGSEIKIAATRLRDAYITSFQKAPSSLKNDYISNFCNVNDNLISNLLSDRKNDDIITFWEKSFKNVNFQKTTTDSRESLVKYAKYTSLAYVDMDALPSALKIKDEITNMSSKILIERPWDWYLRKELIGFYFELGKSLQGAGHHIEAQKALKQAWSNFSYVTGNLLNTERKKWPLKGDIPEDASDLETKFFSRMLPTSNPKREGGEIIISINCLIEGENVPIQFWTLNGKKGYENLQQQFKWIKFYRGIEVASETQNRITNAWSIANKEKLPFTILANYAGSESGENIAEFSKAIKELIDSKKFSSDQLLNNKPQEYTLLWEIAKKNNVSFPDLCHYALNKTDKTKSPKK